MTAPPLDPAISLRCDLARELSCLDRDALALLAPLLDRLDAGAFSLWLLSAAVLGLSLGPALARCLPPVLTGYMPEPVRRSLHHRNRANGLVTDRPRDRSAERAAAYNRQLFGARPVLACEVRP